jgi:hypothetical protein
MSFNEVIQQMQFLWLFIYGYGEIAHFFIKLFLRYCYFCESASIQSQIRHIACHLGVETL